MILEMAHLSSDTDNYEQVDNTCNYQKVVLAWEPDKFLTQI